MKNDEEFYFIIRLHDSLNALTHMLSDVKNGTFPIDKGIDLIIEKSEKTRFSILDYLMEKQKKNKNE